MSDVLRRQPIHAAKNLVCWSTGLISAKEIAAGQNEQGLSLRQARMIQTFRQNGVIEVSTEILPTLSCSFESKDNQRGAFLRYISKGHKLKENHVNAIRDARLPKEQLKC